MSSPPDIIWSGCRSAPESLHPPREQIRQAAAWVIQKTIAMKESEILENYTFYSHVGNALCMWRKTNPSKFWMEWEKTHAFEPKPTKTPEPTAPIEAKPGKPGDTAVKH